MQYNPKKDLLPQKQRFLRILCRFLPLRAICCCHVVLSGFLSYFASIDVVCAEMNLVALCVFLISAPEINP
jgi:hypothetical protein